MKTLKKIENQLKAAGLTGDAFKGEFHKQALLFGKDLFVDMYVGYGLENYDWQDAALCMAHLSEIFVYAMRGEFHHDFAENFQTEVFNNSPEHTSHSCDWSAKIFDAPETENAESASIETGAAYPTDKSEPKKPKYKNIENTAQQISDLLNNPNVPQEIKDALDNALCDTKSIDTTEINAFWKSPEYVAMVLRGYEKAEVSE